MGTGSGAKVGSQDAQARWPVRDHSSRWTGGGLGNSQGLRSSLSTCLVLSGKLLSGRGSSCDVRCRDATTWLDTVMLAVVTFVLGLLSVTRASGTCSNPNRLLPT